MMKQYMKNKSLFLQKEELLSRIAELFSKKILRSSGVLVLTFNGGGDDETIYEK